MENKLMQNLTTIMHAQRKRLTQSSSNYFPDLKKEKRGGVALEFLTL